MITTTTQLPIGVKILELMTHADPRGEFTELFRSKWIPETSHVQWNFVASRANVLRGVHVHRRHHDYLIVAKGEASIAVVDLRKGSPTHGVSALLKFSGDKLEALVIPPGVAHGFYFHKESLHIYSVSEYWSLADEFGCIWNDPGLNINWDCVAPDISLRDAALPTLSELLAEEHF